MKTPLQEKEESSGLRPEQARFLSTIRSINQSPSLPVTKLSRSAVSSKSMETRRSKYGASTESKQAQSDRADRNRKRAETYEQ